jgi:hypothetical protein
VTAGLLFLAVAVDVFVLLLATTCFERMLGLGDSDRWLGPSDVPLLAVVATADLTPSVAAIATANRSPACTSGWRPPC